MTAAAGSTTTTLEAMLQQESVYFHHQNNGNLNHQHTSGAVVMKQAVAALEGIHELCQLQDRETIAIATSYLYRYKYLLAGGHQQQYSLGQIALVCFYMAVKIHQTAALPLKSLTDLYQRFFSVDGNSTVDIHWEKLELQVCAALQWRLHPPMPMAFVDHYLTNTMVRSRRQRKRAQALLEAAFSTRPVAFVGRHRPSRLAAAALMMLNNRCSPLFDDAESDQELQDAVTFLQDCGEQPPTTTTISKKQALRKRCVTPTPAPAIGCTIMARPSKKCRTLRYGGDDDDDDVRMIQSCWTGSPRSALQTVVQDEEA